MAQRSLSSALKDLLQFPFRGDDWQNRFIIGSVLVLANSVIPLLPMVFVIGYGLEIRRRAVRGEELALPPWQDWGRFGLDGLRVALVWLAYMAPGLVVLGGAVCAFLIAFLFFPFLVVALPAFFVGMLLVSAGGIVVQQAASHLAAKDDLGAAFRYQEWWPILRATPFSFLFAWIVLTGLGSVISTLLGLVQLSGLLCLVAPLLTAPVTFYLALMEAALFGRAYREGLETTTAIIAT